MAAGRGRIAVTGCWDEFLKQMAPIVSEVCQSGPWGQAVDSQP